MKPIISIQILTLKLKDDQLREELIRKGVLSDGYHPQMEALHNKNAAELRTIMEQIGYPSADKVGHEASNAAWLIIQHAIGQPEFMKWSAGLLGEAVNEGRADPVSLAYLSDRIAVFEDRPQLYGTQFDWDEHGEMSPCRVDDPALTDERRKNLGLNSLEDQTLIIRNRVLKENQRPPSDISKRKDSYDRWRKRVGWIKDNDRSNE